MKITLNWKNIGSKLERSESKDHLCASNLETNIWEDIIKRVGLLTLSSKYIKKNGS